MANVSRINGFRPVAYLNGAKWNGQVRKYVSLAASSGAIFKGDAVKLTGSAATDGTPEVTIAAAGDALVGVVVGFGPNPDNLNLAGTYRPSGAQTADRVVYVADDPALVFEVQEDAVGGALAAASVGLNAELIVGTGSTTTGFSAMQLDTSTAAATATLALKILGFSTRIDNEVGNANAKVLVKINKHQLGDGTGTAGV